MSRFYCPLPLQLHHTVTLPDAVARHAFGALRLREGDRVGLFNGDGHEYWGRLSGRGQAVVHLDEQRSPARESPLRVRLAQGISHGERMDFTVQKAVELGVTAIEPLLMRRTVVKLTDDKRDKRRAHWQGVVVSACEQCGRNWVPEVGPIQTFDAWRRLFQATGAHGFLLDPEAPLDLASMPPPAGEVVLLAGPEGGLDPVERSAALAAGLVGVRLGPRILRTETAALAALAAMQVLWGDFSGR